MVLEKLEKRRIRNLWTGSCAWLARGNAVNSGLKKTFIRAGKCPIEQITEENPLKMKEGLNQL